MLIFANHQYLILLLLVPLMPLLYGLVRWMRRQRLRRIGQEGNHIDPRWCFTGCRRLSRVLRRLEQFLRQIRQIRSVFLDPVDVMIPLLFRLVVSRFSARSVSSSFPLMVTS